MSLNGATCPGFTALLLSVRPYQNTSAEGVAHKVIAGRDKRPHPGRELVNIAVRSGSAARSSTSGRRQPIRLLDERQLGMAADVQEFLHQ